MSKDKNYLPALWKEDPTMFFSPIERHLQNIFDNTFGSVFSDDDATLTNIFEKNSYPRVNVIEQEDKILVEAEIPGLTKDDISVTIAHNCLVLKGEKKKSETVEQKGTYLRRELKHSSFSRCVGELSDNIDKNNIEAEFKDGVLTVTMKKIKPTPKQEEVKVIDIK